MQKIIINDLNDLNLELADKIARTGVQVELSQGAIDKIESGRRLFERAIKNSDYVYGTTTAPGSRAKAVLDKTDVGQQGTSLGDFISTRVGSTDILLPDRTVRLAILSRVINALSGYGKLSVKTVTHILDLLNELPKVPLDCTSGPGEVVALGWLLSNISDLTLLPGEAMALVNGSPFATAMVTDAALKARKRLTIVEKVLALSIEASGAPHGHYDSRLADLNQDEDYKAVIHRLNLLLNTGSKNHLSHQAPVSWRVIPTLLAACERAISNAENVAENYLVSVMDNPTLLPPTKEHPNGSLVSNGGFHNHQALRAIEQINACWADLCSLISRQVARFVDGGDIGLPPLLVGEGDKRVGSEYLSWMLTAPLSRARQAATPSLLDLSVEDPGGNQSDIAATNFIAFEKNMIVSRSLDTCLATLSLCAFHAIELRPTSLSENLQPMLDSIRGVSAEHDGAGNAACEPFRDVLTLLTEMLDIA
jgi:histidine ammonia-lyase